MGGDQTRRENNKHKVMDTHTKRECHLLGEQKALCDVWCVEYIWRKK